MGRSGRLFSRMSSFGFGDTIVVIGDVPLDTDCDPEDELVSRFGERSRVLLYEGLDDE